MRQHTVVSERAQASGGRQTGKDFLSFYGEDEINENEMQSS